MVKALASAGVIGTFKEQRSALIEQIIKDGDDALITHESMEALRAASAKQGTRNIPAFILDVLKDATDRREFLATAVAEHQKRAKVERGPKPEPGQSDRQRDSDRMNLERSEEDLQGYKNMMALALLRGDQKPLEEIARILQEPVPMVKKRIEQERALYADEDEAGGRGLG
jgi:hypothetical protein